MDKLGTPRTCPGCYVRVQLGVDRRWYHYGTDLPHLLCVQAR